MSDTNYAEEPQTDFDPADFVANEQRRSTARAMASLDADPEKAARAQSLSEATGVNPAIIDGDQENFETQHRAALTASLLANNKFLSGYVDSHPLAAKISNDDYGQLDAASEAIQKAGFSDVPGVGVVPTTTEPGERAINATGSILGRAIQGYRENADIEGLNEERAKLSEMLATNPVFGNVFIRQGVEAGATALAGSMRVFSGLIGGASAGVGEAYKQAGGAESDANKLTRDLIVLAQVGLSGQAGLHGIVHPEVAAEISKFSTAVKPYLDAGKEPPVGVHPLIDEAKSQQAKIDSDNLSDALKESQASKTRERSPDMYADFVRQHTSGEIGISADAVRELYGDKVPATDDGLLGFVPKLAEQLSQAEATGGDVKVPIADWLAKVEPEVAKQLEDHIRVRDGGMTVEETKGESPPVGPVSDPVDSVRQSAALGTIDERKLSLTRIEDQGVQAYPQTKDEPSHAFAIRDNAGVDHGVVYVAEENGGKRLYIDDIRSNDGPQSLGPRAVRQAADQLFEQFPDAEEIKGLRVSGAREAGGKFTDMVVKRKAKPEKQLELPQEGPTRLEDREAFAKASAIGMTVEQYKRYQSLIEKRRAEDVEAANARAEADQRKRQTAEWKANRAELRQQVAEQIRSQPDQRLDAALREGQFKLRTGDLTDEQLAILPKEYVAAKGVSPDSLVGVFGDTTGSGLVDRLATMHKAREASGMNPRSFQERMIEAETDRQMEAKYGKLDRNILEEAKDQVLSETQEELLHEQTMALAADAGLEFSISKEDLKAAVKANVDATAIKNLSSDKFLADAGRAGRATEMALLKGDAAEAFRQSQRQYLAYQFAREARKIEKAQASFAKLAKRMSAAEVKSVLQEYTNFVHDILLRVGLPVKRSVQGIQEAITRDGYKSLLDFVEAKENATFGMREVPIADFLLDDTFRKPLNDLTAWEFMGVKQSIDTLVKQGRDEKKLIAAGEAADLAETLDEMKAKLATFPLKEYPATKGKVAKALDLPRSYIAGMTNIETLLNRWDRNDPRGVFNRYLVRPLTEAANYKAKLDREYAKEYQALGQIKDKDKLLDSPIIDPLTITKDTPEGRPWPGFTRGNALSILQNMGNKGNWDTLTKGYKANPDVLREWMFKNTTKEDWDRAQAMGNMFSSIFSKAETVYHNLTGVVPERIPLEPIVTPYGTYEGWYHPLVKDPIREGTSKKQRGGGVYDENDNFHASIANGYTKRRTGAAYPVDLNMDMVPSRMSQMLHDIAFRQAVIEAEKVFNNKEFREEVTKHYGEIYKDGLMPYLKGVAGAESINSRAASKATQVSEFLRQNVISTYIGFNIHTALKHGPTALVLSTKEVGPANFLNAVKDLYSKSEEIGLNNKDFIDKHSEEVGRRTRHWQDTIAGQHKDIYGEGNLREKIIEKGSWLVAQSDMLSVRPTWLAQYRQSIAEGMDHGQSVFEAERAVRRAHGSTAITNQPSIVRGGGALHGWLTSIYGFFGTMMQRRVEIAHAINDAYNLGRDGELKAAAANVPEIAYRVFAHVIWPTIVEEWVTGLSTDDRRGWGTHLFTAAMGGLASSLIYIRDIVHAAVTGTEPSAGLISSPLHDVNSLMKDLGKGKKMLDRQHAGKLVGDAITVFGDATGMAPKEVGNLAKFGINVANKQERPKTFSDWRLGLTRGTSKLHVER